MALRLGETQRDPAVDGDLSREWGVRARPDGEEARVTGETMDPGARPPGKPYVSVVMPIRNEARFVERSLRAVLAQDYPPDRLEVLVADAMSTDGTRELVAAMGARTRSLRLIDNPEAIVSTGLNRAIADARGEIIVRVDGHAIVDRDYVSGCVETLQTFDADCVGGAMTAVGEGWFGRAVAVAISSPFGVGDARFHYAHNQEWVDTVYLGAWWRTTFDRIGLFDETMVRDQDDEFSYRLLDAGGRILLSPRIRSRYIARGSPRALWGQYFQYGFWKVRVLRLHPRQGRVRQIVPSGFVVALLSTAVAAAIGDWGRAAFVALTAAYGTASIGACVWSVRRAGWALLPGLALAYPLIHVGYGCGFLAGLASQGMALLQRGRQG